MNWTNNHSIRLSKGCIIVFAVVLLGLDLFAVGLITRYAYFRELTNTTRIGMIALCYVLSIPAWILLYSLWKLLCNLKKNEVFTEANVHLLRVISYCCAAAVVICVAGACVYTPVVVIAVPAAFVMLIVRIIKNVFRQAIDMKSELDLTI